MLCDRCRHERHRAQCTARTTSTGSDGYWQCGCTAWLAYFDRAAIEQLINDIEEQAEAGLDPERTRIEVVQAMKEIADMIEVFKDTQFAAESTSRAEGAATQKEKE